MKDTVVVLNLIAETNSIIENESVLRVYDYVLNNHNVQLAKRLKHSIENWGEFSMQDDMDLSVEIDSSELSYDSNTLCSIKIVKFNKPYLFFLTQAGFTTYLKADNSLVEVSAINLPFLKKPFSTNCIRFSLDFEPLEKSTNEFLEVIKYVKPLTVDSQKLLSADVNSWITLEKDFKLAPDCWKEASTKRLLCALSSEVFRENNKIELYFRGERRKKIVFEESNLDFLKNVFKVTTSCIDWIYGQSKDIDTRHGIFNHQISVLLPDSPDQEGFKEILELAFDNSKLAYRYHLQSNNKELTKTLTELNKTLFDYLTKIRQNTTDLMTAVWRDFSTVLGLMLLSFSLKKPDLPGRIYDFLAIALCVYLIASIYLTARVSFWYYNNLKDNLTDWRGKIYSYLSEDEFEKYAMEPLNIAQKKYETTFYVACFLYILMIIFIIVFSFDLVKI